MLPDEPVLSDLFPVYGLLESAQTHHHAHCRSLRPESLIFFFHNSPLIYRVKVFEKLKEDADSFLLKSTKNSTKKTYDSAWKRWSSFIQDHYSGITDPTVENLASSQKLNLMIKFMSTVYDWDLRGDQITVLMSGEQIIIVTRI
jgi:hypothetical protein